MGSLLAILEASIEPMKYVSLFAGIGGFDLALNRLGHTCVFANEWDKYAAQIYDKNLSEIGFPERLWNGNRESWDNGEYFAREEVPYGIDTRDIRTVPTSEIPNHDLLVGGFPCQAFSIAGKRKGFADTRGTLFFEIARILTDKRPRYFILENVKGLLSHDNGKTFSTILGVLTDIGYDYEWQVLNSKNFGVPQNRERVFIVGHIRGQPGPKVFPIREADDSVESGYKQEDTESEVAQTIRNRYGNGTGSHLMQKVGGSQGMRVYDTDGISTTIAGEAGGWGAKTGLYAIPVLTPDRPIKRQNGRRFKEDGDPSFTLTGQDKHGVFDGVKIRRLTPTECERLQGFPDGWTEGVSDTQRYKCLGNAVTVNVVYEVAKQFVL